MPPKVTRSVESKVSPVFGHETEELLALRKLAKVAYKFLTQDDEETEDLERAVANVREIQKSSKKVN